MANKTEKIEIPQRQQYLTPLQHSILEKLNEFGPKTRNELCKKFGLRKHKAIYTDPYEQYDKRTTIYDNLVKLQNRKLIEKFSKSNGKRGRPNIYWQIKEEKL